MALLVVLCVMYVSHIQRDSNMDTVARCAVASAYCTLSHFVCNVSTCKELTRSVNCVVGVFRVILSFFYFISIARHDGDTATT